MSTAAVGLALAEAFGLGLLHGVTPDEHTWPITMSYALGSASGRGGLRAGLYFSLAFTVQRMIGSLLGYFALAGVLAGRTSNVVVYLVVGLVMAASGLLIRRLGRPLHLGGPLERRLTRWLGPLGTRSDQPVPVRLALIHGFIAGWGTGAFAVIIYTTIAPSMPNAALAVLPGAVFGLGTLLVQAAAGAAAGAWMRRRALPPAAVTRLARSVSAAALTYGGLLFAGYGALGLVWPSGWSALDRGVATGLHVPNLSSVNGGTVLVALTVGVITTGAFVRAVRAERRHYPAPAPAPSSS